MDGLRKPLNHASFPAHAWRFALGSYFDAHELVNAVEYGWDISFLSAPNPSSSTYNLPSADDAPDDVDAYIQQELSFGSLIGPFHEKDLPFHVYHSPIGTVFKKSSSRRRTIIDCSMGGRGINGYISAHLHRQQLWKLSLPNTESIVDIIQTTRARYPGHRLLMFKADMSRWY